MNEKKAILVIGAGDATGGAVARRFAREGYIACVTRRTEEKLQPLVNEIRASGGEAYGFGSDARKEEDMIALIEKIERGHVGARAQPERSDRNHQCTDDCRH